MTILVGETRHCNGLETATLDTASIGISAAVDDINPKESKELTQIRFNPFKFSEQGVRDEFGKPIVFPPDHENP